jgi:hypothetical protein
MSNHSDQYWSEEVPKLKELVEIGSRKYFEKYKILDSAFDLKDRRMRCMDEGTAGGLHLAGSGILLDMASAEKFAHESGVDGIYSHEECGAAKLYAQKENLDEGFADDYGREWAKALAEKMKVPYLGHIEIGSMKRPAGLHVAVTAYYDGTGRFDNSEVEELPAGFVISRKFLDPDYAKKELAVAVSIAFGGHGFANKFSKETPFAVVILAESEEQADLLKQEAVSEIVQYEDRVKIDVVVAVK